VEKRWQDFIRKPSASHQDIFCAFGRNSAVPAERDLSAVAGKANTKWLIGILLLALALGILVGAIAAGRLRFLFP